ncbi:hypothetical protein HNP37_001664 [Flavobacterium nitrogenifigens]|uniref:Uncharacterized protein n=2 Tax=Flavobacterium TaxID=237 RepID=A0A7W7N6E9_9FLAO|nr:MULTISPECIES: hypothetical protein [Flavobacterium]MBB4801603.1 hypothetical protein [Flavobacterium nitrogenifigens]MBB6386561.1 hypothetical protein [Flavobacterium notoginsengisoli]
MKAAFTFYYFLFENITKEKKLEIKLATIQERIQKKKKFDWSVQFKQARIKVMNKVVIKFLKANTQDFLIENVLVFTLI